LALVDLKKSTETYRFEEMETELVWKLSMKLPVYSVFDYIG
jgi:hypothetical protein